MPPRGRCRELTGSGESPGYRRGHIPLAKLESPCEPEHFSRPLVPVVPVAWTRQCRCFGGTLVEGRLRRPRRSSMAEHPVRLRGKTAPRQARQCQPLRSRFTATASADATRPTRTASQEQLRGLLEHVREGFTRLDAGKTDPGPQLGATGPLKRTTVIEHLTLSGAAGGAPRRWGPDARPRGFRP